MTLNKMLLDEMMPARIRKLPRDERGYPVPKFTLWTDGKPNFTLSDPQHFVKAGGFRRCWICGEQCGTHVAFVCGPTTAVTAVTSEPGSHVDCAEYALKTCPFMMFPRRARQDTDPEADQEYAGRMLQRNPGVWALWVTKKFTPFRHDNRAHIRLGEPTSIRWFKEGGPAYFDDVIKVLDETVPLLTTLAQGPYRQFIAAAVPGVGLMPPARPQ